MRPRLATSKEPAGCSTVQYSPVYLVNRVSKPYKDPPAPAYFSLSYEHCDVCGNAAPSSSRRPLRTSPTTRPRRSATRSRRRCSSCTRTTSLLGRRDRSSSSAKRTFLPSVFRSSQRPSMSPSSLGGARVQRTPLPPLPPPTLPRSASPSRVSPSTPAKMSVRVWFSFACSATFVLGSASTYSSFLLRTTCLRPIERSLRRYRLRCS